MSANVTATFTAQMFYLYLYTPTLQEGIISLSGNYAATGGYGPNQISTVFGLGCLFIGNTSVYCQRAS